ncbi:hypothetical protein TNCV_807951 [Trichonephila clavipes]|nr:hypothetical protein TNCV_807951 [Trichonephila clavipes]
MDISPKKRTRIATLSQHTSMTVRYIAAAVGIGNSSVSRIINQQKYFVLVSPKRKCGRKLKTAPRTDTVQCIITKPVEIFRKNY